MNNALAALTPKPDYSWLHVAGAMPVLIQKSPEATNREITTGDDLCQFATDWNTNPALALAIWADAGGVIRLAKNIDMNGKSFTPIGTNSNRFTAVFDGQGNTISHLKIDGGSSSVIGLFGNIGRGGVVRNLHLRDAKITGSSYVGGIAGSNNEGTLAACSFHGTVEATDAYAGGIAGRNGGSSSIYGCYSIATSVTAGSNANGIAGWNGSVINGCHWQTGGEGQPRNAADDDSTTNCNPFTNVAGINGYIGSMNNAITTRYPDYTMIWKAGTGTDGWPGLVDK